MLSLVKSVVFIPGSSDRVIQMNSAKERVPMSMRTRLSTVALICAVMVLFCACKGETQSEAGKPETTKADQNKPLCLAGMVFQKDEFFNLVEKGMQDAAGKAGVKFLSGSSDNRTDKEVELINTYITQGVDALVVSPISVTLSVKALQRAHEKGIKVIIHNMPIQADFPVATIESNQTELGVSTGREAARFIQEKLNGQAKVAILAYKSQAPEQSDMRVNGFKSEIAKLPGVEIVAEQDAWLSDMAIKKVDAILTAHPDVNVVYAANEGGTVGATLAVKNKGKSGGQVVVFGTDVSDQLCNFLLDPDDILQAITAQQPFKIGSEAVNAALKSLRNEPVEKQAIVEGILFSRQKPDEVKAYKVQLQEWAK